MEAVEKGLSIFFSLLILGQALLVRSMVGTWLFPACMFSLFWFAATFVPLMLLWWIPAQPLAVEYILVCTLAFTAGSFVFDWKRAFATNRVLAGHRDAEYDSWFLRIVFFCLTVLVVVSLIINSAYQGFTVYDVIFNLMETSAQYAEMRYTNELTVNIFGQLSVVLSYVTVAVGGLLFASARRRFSRWLLVFLSLSPSALVMVTQSAKGMMLLSLVLFYGSVLAYRIGKNDLVLFKVESIRGFGILGLVLLGLLTTSFVSRGLYQSEDEELVIDAIINYFASYSSGHLYAFSDWFSNFLGYQSVNAYKGGDHTYGFYTFMSVFKLFGNKTIVPIGIFSEFFHYGDIVSNIYTIYRGLIMDFGLGGSVVFVFATGLFFHCSYYLLLVSRRSVVPVAVFVFMTGYIYMTFIISFLIWNTIYVSFGLLCVVLFADTLRKRLSRSAPGLWHAAAQA